jgi:AbrB family looped-hinge helix DNA binding protein
MGKTRVVRLLRNGQITIPKEFREALHLEPDDLFAVTLKDGKLEVVSARASVKQEGSPWLKELYDLFDPVRRSYAESGMTENEINAELDAAVRDARADRRKRRAAS